MCVVVLAAALWVQLPQPAEAAQAAAKGTVTLVEASPGIGAALRSAPAVVTLTFDQNLKLGNLAVVGPNGKKVGAGTPTISGASISQTMLSGLGAGTYTVRWAAKAQGTLRTKSSYTFSVLAGSGGSPSPTSSASATAPSDSGGPVTTTPTPASPVPSSITAGVPLGPTGTTTASGASVVGSGPDPARSGPDPARSGPGDPSAPAASAPTGAPASPHVGTQSAPLEDTAPAAVKNLASRSRALSAWLIGTAVLIQIGTGLWGLWRWRQARSASDTAAPADRTADRITDGDAEPERDDPWVTSLVGSAASLDRPWTGEIPVHRRGAG